MFTNHTGHRRADEEAIAEKIKRLPQSEIEALGERKGILRDALNSLNARIEELPQREREATLSLLYKEISDKVFEFHLSLCTSAAREKIAAAPTREEKMEELKSFQTVTEELKMLYGIA